MSVSAVAILHLWSMAALVVSPDISHIDSNGLGGQVVVLFNDTTVFRRSPYDAPHVSDGKGDYKVEISCMGFADCTSKVRKIYSILSDRKISDEHCRLPIYANVTLKPDWKSYQEDERFESFDIDASGKCLIFQGKHYRLKSSVFPLLLTRPMGEW